MLLLSNNSIVVVGLNISALESKHCLYFLLLSCAHLQQQQRAAAPNITNYGNRRCWIPPRTLLLPITNIGITILYHCLCSHLLLLFLLFFCFVSCDKMLNKSLPLSFICTSTLGHLTYAITITHIQSYFIRGKFYWIVALSVIPPECILNC